MSEITLKQLEAFIQVAKLGSFKKAADVLRTTQPNISTRISKLEAQIEHVLMTRAPGTVRLTPSGEELLKRSRNVLNAVDDLLAFSGTKTLFSGKLRVGVTETIAHSWLGDFLNAFASAFPNVTLELRVDLSEYLSRALNENEIDLALQNGPFSEPSAEPIHLGMYSMTWAAAPGFKLPKRRLTKLDLVKHSILSHSRKTRPFQELEDHFKDAPVAARLVPSNSVTACLEMTRQGIGIACLPTAIVQGDLARGTLIELNYEWVPKSLLFEARYHEAYSSHYVREAALIAADVAQKSQPQ